MTRRTSFVLALLLAGCRAPDFTERRALADETMDLAEDPTEVRFRDKATASREAAPGAGGGAGGGCGCY